MDALAEIISKTSAAVVSLLATTWLGRWLSNRKQSPKAEEAQKSANPLIVTNGTVKRSPAQPAAEEAIERGFSPASHLELWDSVKDVTPFHQSEAIENLKGVRVKWRVRLDSISRYRSHCSVYVAVDQRKHCGIFCSATEEACAALITARREALLEVDGQIERFDEFECSLENCTFCLLDE